MAWVLHVGILTFSYPFVVLVKPGYMRARYNFLCPKNLELDSRIQFESLKEVTIRVKSPKESIKTLSKHPPPFLFEILALLGFCDMFHVTNGGLNFGWFPGRKI